MPGFAVLTLTGDENVTLEPAETSPAAIDKWHDHEVRPYTRAVIVPDTATLRREFAYWQQPDVVQRLKENDIDEIMALAFWFNTVEDGRLRN